MIRSGSVSRLGLQLGRLQSTSASARLSGLGSNLDRQLAVRVSARFSSGLNQALLIGVFGVSTAAYLLHDQSQLHLEAKGGYDSASQLHGGKVGKIEPGVFMWGNNEHNLAPNLADPLIRKAKLVLDKLILRDLVLAEKFAVAVDERGDVMMWGQGFTNKTAPGHGIDPTAPHPVLVGKDIISLTVSPAKIFALSRKGEIFIFPVEAAKQAVGAEKRKVESQWYKMAWLRGKLDCGTDMEILKTDVVLRKGEKFVSTSAGSDHLVALTSEGRAFASPLTLSANAYGQLGVKKVALLSLHPSSVSAGERIVTMIPDPSVNEISRRDLVPPKLDPLLMNYDGSRSKAPEPIGQPDRAVSTPTGLSVVEHIILHEDPVVHTELENDIRFSTTLHVIPSLKNLRIDEIVAGEKHTLARTAEGRVLGWGANGYGQLGLGASLSFASIPVPTEIPLARCYPKATRLVCQQLAAGGNLSYFVVEKEDIQDGRKTIDLLATGNGQFGGIGNGSWAHAPSPIRVKTISGLLEWSDKSQSIEPIPIKSVSVGHRHIAIVLDNAVEQPGGIYFGRDVFVWGLNEHFQLGTGKRNSLSTPQHLPPLPYTGLSAPSADGPELLSSGTLSPMPHKRLQLAPEITYKGKRVEETIVAGVTGSAVYWRVLEP